MHCFFSIKFHGTSTCPGTPAVRPLGVSLNFTHVGGVLVLAIETGGTYP
jgi:hypothetical protein